MIAWTTNIIFAKQYQLYFFRDRFRTAINVMGDTFAAAVVEKFSQKDFENQDPHQSISSLELLENKGKSEDTNL